MRRRGRTSLPEREKSSGLDASIPRPANSSSLIAGSDDDLLRLEKHPSLLRGRRQIDEAEIEGLLGHIDDDLQRGRLARPIIDLGAAFRRAEELSRKHASKTLARTLDVLHVAALIEIGCGTLVSGDERQIILARADGSRFQCT